VLDNDDAEKREGVQCTYKKVGSPQNIVGIE
jgi:hypothetical protein